MPSAAVKRVEFDPKQDIIDRIGDLSKVEIAQNEVLIAVYKRQEKTAGGIILTHSNLKEDEYQGKVGLVLKIGAACRFERFDVQRNITFGIPVEIHDWVVVRPSDTWRLDVNGNPGAVDLKDFIWCRLCYDDQIRMKIPDPGMVY